MQIKLNFASKNGKREILPCVIAIYENNLWPLKKIARKILIMAIVTVAFGWFYSKASPWAFPQNKTAGFGYGVLHGALMPIALPSLVIGKDVPIYAADNSGRFYKIGYICGINLCGIAFFGPIFYRPKRKSDSLKG